MCMQSFVLFFRLIHLLFNEWGSLKIVGRMKIAIGDIVDISCPFLLVLLLLHSSWVVHERTLLWHVRPFVLLYERVSSWLLSIGECDWYATISSSLLWRRVPCFGIFCWALWVEVLCTNIHPLIYRKPTFSQMSLGLTTIIWCYKFLVHGDIVETLQYGDERTQLEVHNLSYDDSI